MKKFLSVILIFSALFVQAQKGIVNNGARIVIESGAYIKVQNDNTAGYTNKSYGTTPGRIELDGEIQLNGFFNNNASQNEVFINQDGTGRVVFYGSSLQTVGGTYATHFEGIELAGTGGVSLDKDTTCVWGSLVFSQGKLYMNGNVLELATTSANVGTIGTSSMIVPGTGGIVRKYYTTAADYTFPIGENDGTPYYIPVEVNFASGTFNPGAYVDLEMVPAKHPDNVSTTDYLSRYWVLSQSNISGFSADVLLKYTDADINGTEANLSSIRYDGSFWDIFDPTNTSINLLNATVAELGEFTGGNADDVSPHLTWDTDGILEENAEDGEQLKVSIENDEFVSTLNDVQWNVTGLPNGVTVGNIMRTHADTVIITLSGNRLDDFDSDVILDLTVDNSEFVHTSSGVLNAENSLSITAIDDLEELTMSDDGSITEGSEDGEIITVTLTGGTFAQALTTGNWSAVNMPTGVSLGTITRISATEVQVLLSGNASVDYDTDITNFELTIPASDVNEYTGSDFVLSTGVTFTAIDEDLTINMSDGGSGIDEGFEDGHMITVTISERVFTDPLTPGNWTIQNLPGGVSFGSVVRNSDTEAYVYLAGNRTVDYDADITNMEIRIAAGEIDSYSNQAIINSGVTFNADIDAESITIATDPDGITEGDMSSDYITATISGGTFVSTPQKANWTLNNLPAGVSIGSLTYNSPTEVQINLTGTPDNDFDSDITTIDLDILASDFDDSDTDITSDNTITISAVNDEETIALSGGPFIEGAEDGEIITATLSGGNFVAPVDLADVTMNNLPDGVTLGDVVYQNQTEVDLVLAGNATIDYDVDITNVSATFSASVIEETSTDISGTGVTFEAVIEPASLVLSDNGAVVEGDEAGQELYIEVVQDTLVASIDPSAFTLSGLPEGISANSITRTNDNLVTITLTGTRTQDYDTDITSAGVTIDASQLQYSASPLSASNGWTFIAINDNESISFSALSSIIEGSEAGSQIDVNIAGGTFPDSQSATEWSLNNTPAGVSIGSVTRNSETNLTLTLAGNASADYDVDIVADVLTISGSQIDDFTDPEFYAENNSITFEAIIETQNLILSSTSALYEPDLDGAVVDLEISGATFITPIDPANFALNNVPPGVTKQSVTYVDDNHVQITLAFDGTDFDTDYTDFYVSLSAAGSSIGENGNSNAYTIEAYLEPGTFAISHTGLTEENINGAVVDLTLTGDEFVDNTLNKANFSIQNAPDGTSIAAVAWVTNTTATLELAFDGHDFDSDYTDFTVSILGAETATGYDYTSNTLTITATNDDESITFSTSANIQEGSEDGAVIDLVLSGGTFNETLDPGAFVINGLPSGVTVGDVNYINPTEATITLLGNATADYDTDIVITEIIVAGYQIFDYELADLVATGTITFEAIIESQNLVLSSLTSLDEYNLDGAILGGKLEGATFVTPVEPSNFELNNLPPGAGLTDVSLIDSDSISIELYFDGTDFDVDYNDFNLTLLAAGSSLGESISSNALPIAAVVETGTLEIAHAGLSETNLDGAVIDLTLIDDEFADDVLEVANFGLSGAPAGVSIASVTWISNTTAQLTTDFDGTDFDNDYSTFAVTLQSAEVVSNNSYTSNMLLIQAVNDNESVSFAALNTITEGAEDGAQIEAILTGGTYAQTLMVNEWVFTGLPSGVTLGNIDRIDHTNATLTLAGNATSDYDFDIIVDQLTIGGSQIDDFEEPELSAQGSITFTAINETQELFLSTIDPLTESTLDGAVLGLKLSDGSFITPLSNDDFILNNQPVGTSIQSVSDIQADSATVTLAFDGTDFDTDVTDFSVTLLAQANSTSEQLISNAVTITAEIETESLLISHAGLTEDNLDGAVINLELVLDTFEDDVLDPANFNLENAPEGCEISALNYISATEGTIDLSYNGTDFDTDVTDFAVTMQGAEVASGTTMTSNNLTISAVNDAESIAFNTDYTVQESDEDGAIFEVVLTGGTFNPTLTSADWSMSWLPTGVTISDVEYVDPSHANLQISGIRSEDYDNQENATLEVAESQFDASDGAPLVSDNAIAFIPYVESLQSLADTVYESNINETTLEFEFTDEWVTDLSANEENFTLENAPVGLSISGVSITDSAHFSIGLAYTGTSPDQDQPFSILVSNNILNGVEDVLSNAVVFASDVGVKDLATNIDLYTAGNEIYLKQYKSAQKGKLEIYAVNGQITETLSVEAKGSNSYQPFLKDGMYLLRFVTEQGKIYQHKGVIKN